LDYLQVALTVKKPHSEQLSDLLETAGALSVTVESASNEEIFDAAQPGDPMWKSQRLTALFDGDFDVDVLSYVLKDHPEADHIVVSNLPDQDWERNWLEQFVPLQVGQALWVCPSWLEPPDSSATNLIIDPGLAFGTGTHQTTHLCLNYLSTMDLKGKLVIDFGCGSGILAIAAIKLGAEEAVAVDIDPKAIDATRSNAEINQVSSKIHVGLPQELDSLLQGRRSPLVIANILADTLIELKNVLLNMVSPDSILLLSGVLASQMEKVTRSYSPQFRFVTHQKEEWMLLEGQSSSD